MLLFKTKIFYLLGDEYMVIKEINDKEQKRRISAHILKALPN